MELELYVDELAEHKRERLYASCDRLELNGATTGYEGDLDGLANHLLAQAVEEDSRRLSVSSKGSRRGSIHSDYGGVRDHNVRRLSEQVNMAMRSLSDQSINNCNFPNEYTKLINRRLSDQLLTDNRRLSDHSNVSSRRASDQSTGSARRLSGQSNERYHDSSRRASSASRIPAGGQVAPQAHHQVPDIRLDGQVPQDAPETTSDTSRSGRAYHPDLPEEAPRGRPLHIDAAVTQVPLGGRRSPSAGRRSRSCGRVGDRREPLHADQLVPKKASGNVSGALVKRSLIA